MTAENRELAVRVQPQEEFSEAGYWDKLRKYALRAGSEVVQKSLWLFYAAQRPETPLWAKTVVYSALAYFILPADAVPDMIPGAGYVDDLGALAAAVATISMHVTEDVKAQAEKKMRIWFGSD